MQEETPRSAIKLMSNVYRKVFPEVDRVLSHWKSRAKEIPNVELRTQALDSMETKRFHCQGGSVYALLAGERWREAVQFIVAYQTVSDYLDNLCDRSTSMDPSDFSLLHQAMHDAITPGNLPKNYYLLREEREDGGYLSELVQTCQHTIEMFTDYTIFQSHLYQLESMYKDLQVHKHVRVEERVPRLTKWFDEYKNEVPTLSWYEFSAATGSTLGVFCIVSYALGGVMSDALVERIYGSYFPFVQGLHILLDYYIDQQEDIQEQDLNFCSYYPNQEAMLDRMCYFIHHAIEEVQGLPDVPFHEMVIGGLVGLYLGDAKVRKLKGSNEIKKRLLKKSGYKARFFHWNTKLYYTIKPS